MRWRDISYAYVGAVCRNKQFHTAMGRYLHVDTQRAWKLVEKVYEKYKKFPKGKHFVQYLNIELKPYIQKCPTDVDELVDLLKQHYIKSITEDAGALLHSLSTGEELDSNIVLQEISKLESEIASTKDGKHTRLSDGWNVLKDFANHVEKPICKFGFKRLDYYTGGIFDNQYIILYAKSGQGKSTMARKIATNIALQGKTVLYLTLEETDKKSVIKSMATEANFCHIPVFDGKVTPSIAKKVKAFQKELSDVGGDIIFVSRVEHKGVAELKALKDRYKPDIIFIDQLSLFIPNDSIDTKDITPQSKKLKKFCQFEGTPIFLLAQEARNTNKKADIDNIGYSAGIGHDGDIVIYLPTETDEGEEYTRKMCLAKNRDRMPNIEIDLIWNLDEGIIREMDDEEDWE